LKIEIVFRRLGPEAPNPPIEIELDSAHFFEIQRAWEKLHDAETSPFFLLKSKREDVHAQLLLRLDLIAYIRVISR